MIKVLAEMAMGTTVPWATLFSEPKASWIQVLLGWPQVCTWTMVLNLMNTAVAAVSRAVTTNMTHVCVCGIKTVGPCMRQTYKPKNGLPSGNQTWQWKILSRNKTSISFRDFPTFDDRRVLPLTKSHDFRILLLLQVQPIWLVVWTPLKNISQLGWLVPIYGK